MTRDGAAVTDEWLDVSTCGTDGDASAAQRSLSVCLHGGYRLPGLKYEPTASAWCCDDKFETLKWPLIQ